MHFNLIRKGIIFLILALIFIPLAVTYPIREDEGYYLMAARLVMQGRLPYVDFFYTQTPLLPYIYGIWMKIFAMSWFSARVFAGMLCASLTLVLFEHTRTHLGKVYGAIAVILFMFCNLTFDYQIVAKTYTLSTLFLFIAYALFNSKQARSFKAIFWAGFFFALAVNVRLFFVGLAPVFCWEIWRSTKKREFFCAFGVGMSLGLLPNLVLIAINFDNYWFGNLGYHFVRLGSSDPHSLFFKWNVLENILGIRKSVRYNNPQFALLLYPTLLYGLLVIFKRKKADMALGLGLLLSLINFGPTPTFTQYFTTVVPFYIICTLLFFKELEESPIRKVSLGILAVYIYVYLNISPLNMKYYLNAQKLTLDYGKRRSLREYSLEFVSAFSKRLDSLVPQGEIVVSVWPGYLLESKANMLPGLENQFGVQIGEGVEPERRRRLRILSESDLFEIVKNRAARWVILGHRDEVLRQGEKTYRENLEENGYKVVLKIGSVRIFQAQDQPIAATAL